MTTFAGPTTFVEIDRATGLVRVYDRATGRLLYVHLIRIAQEKTS